ncbi:unnamed protein product, partial [marine sediment metagenome]
MLEPPRQLATPPPSLAGVVIDIPGLEPKVP